MALVPLTIPAGWHVSFHELSDLDPETLAPDSPDWVSFTEDLLQIGNEGNVVLDVGWYPDGSPSGRYRLVVVVDRDWTTPRVRWGGRSLRELVAEIDRQLAALAIQFPGLPVATLIAQLRDPEPEQRAKAAEWLALRGAVEALDAVQEAHATERKRDIELRMGAALDTLVRSSRR